MKTKHWRIICTVWLIVVVLLAINVFTPDPPPFHQSSRIQRIANVGAPSRTGPGWPFSKYSIWNMPIGANAVYADAGLSGGNQSTDYQVQVPDQALVNLDSSQASQTLFLGNYIGGAWNPAPGASPANRCTASATTLATIKAPSTWVIAGASPGYTPNSTGVFATSATQFVQTQPVAHCTSGGSWTSQYMWAAQTYGGDGQVGAHGGSGLSALGGLLRIGEMRPADGIYGPAHALAISINAGRHLAPCSGSSCFKWPAVQADSYASTVYGLTAGSTANTRGYMKMGALLALTPAAYATLMTQLTTQPAKQIAWTLRNYGTYVNDDTGWDAVALNAEVGPTSSFASQLSADYGLALDTGYWTRASTYNGNAWQQDLQRIFGNLSAVTNNGPTSIGGGGDPAQCYAPAFSDGTTDTIGTNPNGTVTEPVDCSGGGTTTTTAASTTLPPSNCAAGRVTGATASVSSVSSSTVGADKLLDGDESTAGASRWISQSSDPQSMTIVLPSALTLTSIAVKWAADAGPAAWTIAGSNDGTTFTTISSGGDSATSGAAVCRSYGLSGNWRYVRFSASREAFAVSQSPQYGLSAWEVGVYGTVTTTTSTTTTVAPLGCMPSGVYSPAIPSASSGSAQALADANEVTAWVASSTAPQSIVLDLGQGRSIGSATILWAANRAGRLYVVQTSTFANGPWTTRQVVSGYTTGGAAKCWTSKTFTGVNARYVRIVIQTMETFAVGPASINEIGIKA